MSKTLIEIPVYYKSEEYNEEYWDEQRKKYINHQIATGLAKEKANNSFVEIYNPLFKWDFNRIIGYIRIEYNNKTGSLDFIIYESTNKKFNIKYFFKMKFDKINGPNLSENVKYLNNDEIVEKINMKINYVKESFFKNNFIDLKCLENMNKYFDYKKFIQEEKRTLNNDE